MKKSRFTEEQIIDVLREQGPGRQRHGISEQTFYLWKAKYGGMGPSDATLLKGLENKDRYHAITARSGSQMSICGNRCPAVGRHCAASLRGKER